MPAVENILSDHMSGTEPMMSDQQGFINIALTADMIFDKNGKSISLQRFHNKIVKDNKSVLTCHELNKERHGNKIAVFDSVLTKPNIYINIRKNILQILEKEYIRVIAIKKITEGAIVFDEGFPKRLSVDQMAVDDIGLSYFYRDVIEVNQSNGALMFPKDRFQNHMLNFAECIEKTKHPIKDDAYEMALSLIESNYDIFVDRRYGFNRDELSRYKGMQYQRNQSLSEPELKPKRVKQKKYSETFYQDTFREIYEHFEYFNQGDIGIDQYKYDMNNFFKYISEEKGIALV